MTNKEWTDLIVKEFPVSRSVAKDMLHAMFDVYHSKCVKPYHTCAGCYYMTNVDGITVCWLPFAQKTGNVHTVCRVTNDSPRCDNYRISEYDE